MAQFKKEELKKIFDHSSGKCHICHERLVFGNYGNVTAEGAWEVDHSKAQAIGGTHHINNLYPACPKCNRSKGKKSSRSVRAAYGKKRAPLSVTQREKAIERQGKKGAGLGALAGYLLDPTGVSVVTGFVLGGLFGRSKDPDD